uniref:Uncharacterized protein n=1 Tax=Chelonoidis abingdonii TaxID=106734 RepID=A0A8C0IV34_CHEAB
MPHFTVVPVADKQRGDYDSLEGLSWVDYSEPGGAEAPDASDYCIPICHTRVCCNSCAHF